GKKSPPLVSSRREMAFRPVCRRDDGVADVARAPEGDFADRRDAAADGPRAAVWMHGARRRLAPRLAGDAGQPALASRFATELRAVPGPFPADTVKLGHRLCVSAWDVAGLAGVSDAGLHRRPVAAL